MTQLTTVDEQTEDEYGELRKEVLAIRDEVEDKSWNLAVKLMQVHDSSAYTEWGFGKWKDYVEQELAFKLRKANYLVSIAQWFGELNKPIQKWVSDMGWSKAKELVGVVTNENAAEWKKRVKGKSVAQIQHMLEESQDESGSDDGAEGGDDQGKPASETSKRKAFSLFDGQQATVDKALAKAAEMSQSDKEGHNLDMICVEFLATHAAMGTVDDYLRHVEHTTGLKLLAYDPKGGDKGEGDIVFGDSLLEELAIEEDEVDAEGGDAESSEGSGDSEESAG